MAGQQVIGNIKLIASAPLGYPSLPKQFLNLKLTVPVTLANVTAPCNTAS